MNINLGYTQYVGSTQTRRASGILCQLAYYEIFTILQNKCIRLVFFSFIINITILENYKDYFRQFFFKYCRTLHESI